MSKSSLHGIFLILIGLFLIASCEEKRKTPKAVFIIVDGIPGDVIEKLDPRVLKEISAVGGFTRAYVGGAKGTHSETPTISAVGYNSLLTGTWVHKHNVWGNGIEDPNYQYWNIFRIAKQHDPNLNTAIFSTWLDNRTKLVGEGLEKAGNVKLDYSFDGFELDTVTYPHDDEAKYINRIDEAVADEAARYLQAYGPDLSWVYLEYTDDMGHRYGDSPQFYDAIKTADQQIGKIWNALKVREKDFDEDWLIVITTDHGRDAATGKNHGGQSDRERSTWIVSNSKKLNHHFQETPGVVDIMPSLARHLGVTIPEETEKESDGVSFIGAIDLSGLSAARKDGTITLRWKSQTKNKDEKLEVFVTDTNHFREGGRDVYQKTGEVPVGRENYSFPIPGTSPFYKILVKTPHQYTNAWVVIK